MPRSARHAPPGIVYHVLNRSNGRVALFRKAADFVAFERVIVEAHRRAPLRILDYVIMRNHWHFVVLPERDGEMSDFFRWLALTHAARWHEAHGTKGTGHVYAGRFKSFPVQDGAHLRTMLRYVERNPVRAGIVEHAADYRWGSAHVRQSADAPDALRAIVAARWPFRRPEDWSSWVDQPQTAAEEVAARLCITRGRPFGDEKWSVAVADRMGLSHTLRSRGRPRKSKAEKGLS